MDSPAVATSSLAAIVTLALSYYSLRTIRLFKSSVAARAWVYISIGGILFSLGAITFVFANLDFAGIGPLGGILDTLGGTFLLLGLRKNFLFWSSPDHFT